MAVTGMAGRHHAIEHINAAQYGCNDVLGPAHAHQIARPVDGHVWNEGFEDAQPLLLGLAHSEPPYRQTREVESHQGLERCKPQGAMHAALDDPEQPARWLAASRGFSIVMSVAPGGPAHGALHRFAGLALGGGVRRAVVQRHCDVRAQLELHVHRVFRREPHVGAVDWGAEAHPFLRNLTEALEAENLETTRVSENGVLPVHESV